MIEHKLPCVLCKYCIANLLVVYLVTEDQHIPNEIQQGKFHSKEDPQHDGKFDSDHRK